MRLHHCWRQRVAAGCDIERKPDETCQLSFLQICYSWQLVESMPVSTMSDYDIGLTQAYENRGYSLIMQLFYSWQHCLGQAITETIPLLSLQVAVFSESAG